MEAGFPCLRAFVFLLGWSISCLFFFSSVSLSLSVSVYCLYPPSVCICLCLSISVSVSLSMSMSAYLFLSLCLSLLLSLSFYLCQCTFRVLRYQISLRSSEQTNTCGLLFVSDTSVHTTRSIHAICLYTTCSLHTARSVHTLHACTPISVCVQFDINGHPESSSLCKVEIRPNLRSYDKKKCKEKKASKKGKKMDAAYV